MLKHLTCTLLFLCLGHFAAGNSLSNEDLRHVRGLSEPQLSPDGRRVLVQIQDGTSDGGLSHLWLVEIGPDSARQLTFTPTTDKRGEYAGRWMPDGGSILFLAKRGDDTQLFRLPMDGGEAHPYDLKVTPVADASSDENPVPPEKADDTPEQNDPVALDVESFAVSPDGKTIAILARDPETPREKSRHDEKADAEWLGHDPHGMRLYFLELASEKLTVSGVPADVKKIAWSHRSDRLVAITAGPNNQSDLGPANGAWLVSPGSPDHPSRLAELPATIADGSWSEDDARFYFPAQSAQDAPPGYSDLYVMEFSDRSVRNLSAGFGGSINELPPVAAGKEELQPVQMGTRLTYARIDADKLSPLTFDTPAVTQLGSNARQTGWVWLGSGSTQPEALYFADKPGHAAKKLDTPSLLSTDWTPVPSHLVQWRNEGLTVEGLLYLPPQAKGGKVPLIVGVHGGPTEAWSDEFDVFTNFLVGQGWAVLLPNPRGSSGYGARFAAANKNDLGGGDFRDIMAGVDAMIASYPIDVGRLALIGYSYGGEMAGFAEGRTDRFRAIVSGAPVIDQESEYGTEDESWYDRWFYGGKPWDHAEDAWRQSPLAHVAHAVTPFMLIQGESDVTDPLGQSLEMYRALRQVGVKVEMVQYPREDHGPLADGLYGSPTTEPWHGFDARQRVVKFITAAFEKAPGAK